MRSETSAVHGQPKRAKPNAKPMFDSVLCLRASWWDADTCPVSSFCHAPYDKNRKQSQGGMCHSSRFVHKVVGTSPILPQLACLGWFQVGLQSTPKGGCATTSDELSSQICVFKRLKFRISLDAFYEILLTCKDVCRSSHSWPIYEAFCARQPKTTQGPTNQRHRQIHDDPTPRCGMSKGAITCSELWQRKHPWEVFKRSFDSRGDCKNVASLQCLQACKIASRLVSSLVGL